MSGPGRAGHVEAADPRLQRAGRDADRLLGRARASLSEEDGSPKIYADTDWYAERPEQEQEWAGVLRRREPEVGPDNRPALNYTLVTSGGELDVYAAHVDEILAPLDDRRVVARGKLVDLGDAGRGLELWLASVEVAPGAD